MCFAVQIFQVPGLSPRQWFWVTNLQQVKTIQYTPTQSWYTNSAPTGYVMHQQV